MLPLITVSNVKQIDYYIKISLVKCMKFYNCNSVNNYWYKRGREAQLLLYLQYIVT